MIQSRRNSSFELLRILLIFLVIIGHANVWYIGFTYNTESEHVIKVLLQVICMPAVNAFVLISGWFGIKANISKIISLLFQMLFITVPVAIVMWILGKVNLLSLENFNYFVLGGNNYWFIINYIGLLLVAPLLNNLFNNSSKEALFAYLFSFLLFVVPLDVILRSKVLGLEGGYSLLWFIYLYILGRYIRKFDIIWLDHNKWIVLVICVIAQSILFYFHLIGNRYTNPLILLPAICLILIFKDFSFHNQLINNLASATLMAYMIHMHPCFINDIREILVDLYIRNGYCLYM